MRPPVRHEAGSVAVSHMSLQSQVERQNCQPAKLPDEQQRQLAPSTPEVGLV